MFKKILLSLALILITSQAAQMRIDQYPQTTTLGNYDLLFTTYYGGSSYTTNKNITFTNFVTQLSTLVGGGAGKLSISSNLSDVANVATARSNLGAAAQTDLTTVSNTVVANTASIALKADQSNLTIVSNTVVANTASIALKANQTDLTTVSNSVVANTAAIATKQTAFTTGLGITNVNNVLSNNIAAGSNITLTPGANGQITIASTGGGGSAPSGTMVSNGSGFSSGSVPKASDTTGTNFTGSGIIITSTNMSIPGTLNVDNIVATNGVVIGGGSTNLQISGNFIGNGAVVTNTLTLNGVSVTDAAILTTGTLPSGRMPALTGAVTSSAGSTATTLTTNQSQQKVWVSVGSTNLGVFDHITFWPGSNITITTTNGTGNTNIDVAISASGGGGGGLGYLMKFGGSDTSANPANGGFTYYLGSSIWGGPTTVYDRQKLYVPQTGTLKKIFVRVGVNGTLGTTEAVDHKVSINGGAATGTGVSLTYDTINNFGASTSESISVTAGDYIALTFTTPTWATPPTTCIWEAWAYIE